MRLARLSPRADDEFLGITRTLLETNPAAAAAWVDAVEAALARIRAYPRIGHRREDLTAEDLRFYSVFSYLLVYRMERGAPIVVAILHAARDVSAQLRDDPGDAS